MTPVKIFSLLFILSLFLRLPLWLHNRATPARFLTPDSSDYLTLAKNLKTHGEFSLTHEHPETVRTPGYPSFLALAGILTGNDAALLSLFQMIVLCAFPWIVYRLSWLCWRDSRGALVAGICAALDLNSILHSLVLLSDSFFCLCLALGILFFVLAHNEGRAAHFIFAGLALAIASLVRPIGLYFPLTMLPWLRRTKRAFFSFLLGAYLLPCAWIVRNHALTGYWQFSSIAEWNLLYYRALPVESLSAAKPPEEIWSVWQTQLKNGHPEPFRNQVEQYRYYGSFALAAIRQHPLVYVKLSLIGTVKTLGGHATDMLADMTVGPRTEHTLLGALARLSGSGTRGLLREYPFFWLALLLSLSFLGFVYFTVVKAAISLWRRREFYFLSLFGWGLIYFLALSSGAESYYRFRLPLMVFLLPLGADAWRNFYGVFRRKTTIPTFAKNASS